MRSSVAEEYELNVLAGKQRELPVYSVAQTEQLIALTIDAAWEDTHTRNAAKIRRQDNVLPYGISRIS